MGVSRSSLRTKSDFQRVFADGRKVVAPEVVVHAAQGQPEAGRLGIVVSKRNGGAVERNRLRRRLREAVKACGGVPRGYDVVVIARPAGKQAGFDRLKDRLWKILEELKMTPTGAPAARSPRPR